MSYLGYPRLHFSGKFQAAPSTVNNDPVHFDSDIFTPNDQLPQNKEASNGWWNPEGHAYWRLREASVTSVVYKDGTVATKATDDPIIGQPIADGDESVPGKIVDLDPEQQMVSEIWGWSIKVGSPKTVEDVKAQVLAGFKASFHMTPFNDIWQRAQSSGSGGDMAFGAAYHSILQNVEMIGDVIDSKFLEELKDDKGNFPSELSMKFNVDGYEMDSTSPDFTWGRINGTIGPYDENEPKHFVKGRHLGNPQAVDKITLNYAPAYIDENLSTITLDMGNSTPTKTPGGSSVDLGTLTLGVMEGKTFHEIGAIPYDKKGFIATSAGVTSFKLSKKLLNLASNNPLAIQQSPKGKKSASPSVMLNESDDGVFVRADMFVFRMEANSEADVILYTTKFGKYEADVEVNLRFDESSMQTYNKDAPFQQGPEVGKPKEALGFPKSVKSDKNGKITFKLTSKDPGNPRKYIDGQIYGVQYLVKGQPSEQTSNSNNTLSLLIFDGYSIDSSATWVRDVQPILVQYANLYPVMKKILDLNSYHSVVSRKKAMSLVFSQDVSSANYMPVTRDLSAAKRDMLLGWLDQLPNPKYIEIKTKEDLQQALQIAIELEHSTLPPYLTAYWSIIPGHNNQVSEIIRSVIMEEMLHMSLACNLLNAIGGEPKINVPGFVPIYPTGLPGSLAPGLNVTLKKCSIDQIREVFMGIENPDYVEVLHKKKPDAKDLDHHQMTIGWFYDIIKRGFKTLNKELGHDGLFTGDPTRQMTSWHGEGDMIEVTNLKSAKKAIKEIVEEGEGASPYNPKFQGDLAHYYKFSEIVEGREIVINRKKNGFSYSGAVIPFDPKGIYPMKDNPGLTEYSNKSAAKTKSEMFNKSYTSLLNKLHQVFNGDPDGLAQAIGLMFSLTVQARDLMKTPVEPGATETAGPSFRYYPINYDT